MADKLLLPQKEAATLLGIPLSQLRAERQRGKIRYKRIGHHYWYHRSILEAYAATMEGEGSEHTRAETGERIRSLRRHS